VLRPLRDVGYAYAVLTAFDEKTVGYASGHSRGTTIPYAVWEGSLDSMSVVIPHEAVLIQFDEIAKPILSRVALSGGVETNLRLTRDLLLPRLMSGKVSVEDITIEVADAPLQEVAEVSK
jgi:type I restriction enzyme, S subunit